MQKKYFINLLFLLFLILHITGCTIKNELELIQNPKLGIVNTQEIGNNLYEKLYVRTSNEKFVQIKNNVILPNEIIKAPFIINNLLNHHINKDWKYSCIHRPVGILGASSYLCLYDTNNDLKFDKYEFKPYSNNFISNDKDSSENKYENLIENVPYTYEVKVLDNFTVEESFKYIALYQGKNKNKIKISYREYLNNMARPSFTQDIEYELEENASTIIGFKGLRIEVLKATNFDITYKVIKDYN